jgi:hypothetical protein
MRRLLPGCFLLGVVLAPVPALAAGPGIDYTGYVTTQIDSLISGSLPAMQSIGNNLLTWIGIIMLVVYALRWMAHSASRHHPEFPFGELMHFFGLFLVAEMMLRYYDVPLGIIGGVSIHQALPKMSQDLAGHISVGSLTIVIHKIAAIIQGIQKPTLWDPIALFVYVGILLDMGIIQAALFAITILGFIAVGIGGLVGPVFIPWLIVPRLNWLFWNWFSFVLQYSFYSVIANALVFIWTNVLINFIDQVIHADYTLAHFLLLLPAIVVLNVGMFYSVFKITSFVTDLFKGAAGAGAGFSSAVGAAVKGAFA